MQRLFQNLSGQRSRNAAVPTFGNFFYMPLRINPRVMDSRPGRKCLPGLSCFLEQCTKKNRNYCLVPSAEIGRLDSGAIECWQRRRLHHQRPANLSGLKRSYRCGERFGSGHGMARPGSCTDAAWVRKDSVATRRSNAVRGAIWKR